jgi:Sigma-70 region 3
LQRGVGRASLPAAIAVCPPRTHPCTVAQSIRFGKVWAGSEPGRAWLLMLPVHLALVDDQSTRVPGVDRHPPVFRPCRPRGPPRRPGGCDPGRGVAAGLRRQAATRCCGSGSSWPTWAWPAGSATATTGSRGSHPDRPGRADRRRRPLRPRPGHPVRPLRHSLCGRPTQTVSAGQQLAAAGAPPAQGKALRLARATDALHQRLGRSPSTAGLAERLEVGEEEVLEALVSTAGSCRWTSTRWGPGSASPRCTSLACSDTPKPGCAPS